MQRLWGKFIGLVVNWEGGEVSAGFRENRFVTEPTPSPALVSHVAARRVPQALLVLLCAAYVLAGFMGRSPWREVDMAAFGYMQAMADGASHWLRPTLDGMSPADPGLLQYWLGALALHIAPAWMPADVATRLPFMGLLGLTLALTWAAMYHLARMPEAQPVAFAFGGEASPVAYARSMADAALLALLACLGLAQMGHESSHSLVQLTGIAAVLLAMARMRQRVREDVFKPQSCAQWLMAGAWTVLGFGAALLGTLALALAGAAGLGVMLALIGAVLAVGWGGRGARFSWAAWWLLCAALAAVLTWALQLWTWPVPSGDRAWGNIARLLVWFTWPIWPLTLWTLWRWRHSLRHPQRALHLLIPLLAAALVWLEVLFVAALPDRALLNALPAVAMLAAFALPTLKRSLSALIDWLTLIFFTASATTVWVVWISLQTGWPAKPATNVARRAIGFVPSFEWLPFVVAVLATLGWLALAAWRTRRHRPAMWKSLALPAAGTTLGWVLLMTLWLPMLEYGRGYGAHLRWVQQAVQGALVQEARPAGVHALDTPTCMHAMGLSRAHLAALRFHTPWQVQVLPAGAAPVQGCSDWALASAGAWTQMQTTPTQHTSAHWQHVTTIVRPTERHDVMHILRFDSGTTTASTSAVLAQ